MLDLKFLKSLGFLPENNNSGDLFIKIWQPDETEEDEKIHLFVCSDGSYGFEAYDKDGESLSIVLCGVFESHEHVVELLKALRVIK